MTRGKKAVLCWVVLLLLLAAGCSQDAEEGGPRVFDPQTVEVGDMVDGFTVTSVSVVDGGEENVVFSGPFTMTGVLQGNIVVGGGPDKYLIVLTREDIINHLPVATTWYVSGLDAESEVPLLLHTEDRVTAAIGEVRAEEIAQNLADPWSEPAEYRIDAVFSGFIYQNDPNYDVYCILVLDNILHIENVIRPANA